MRRAPDIFSSATFFFSKSCPVLLFCAILLSRSVVTNEVYPTFRVVSCLRCFLHCSGIYIARERSVYATYSDSVLTNSPTVIKWQSYGQNHGAVVECQGQNPCAFIVPEWTLAHFFFPPYNNITIRSNGPIHVYLGTSPFVESPCQAKYEFYNTNYWTYDGFCGDLSQTVVSVWNDGDNSGMYNLITLD